MLKIWFLFVCLLMSFLTLLHAQNSESWENPYSHDSSISQSKFQDSVLVVTGDHNYPPYEFVNRKGETEGFTIDIMQAIADVMKINIEIELRSWSDAREAIETGRADILTGMYRTEERDKLVDFSIPHFISSYAVFVRTDTDIKSVESIRDKVILVQKDDLGHDYVLGNKIGKEIIAYTDFGDLLFNLSQGKGDCAIHSRLQGVRYLQNNNITNITTIGSPLLQRKYCLAVPEGESQLLALLNEGLSILKYNGTYDRIFEKWFGVYEEQRFSWSDALFYLLWIVLPLIVVALAALVWSYMLKKQIRKKSKDLNLELRKRLESQHKLEIITKQLEEQNIKLV